jgi:hypothetical protein
MMQLIFIFLLCNKLEGSTSEKTAASAETLSTDSKTKNEADVKLYAPKQKAFPLFFLYSS